MSNKTMICEAIIVEGKHDLLAVKRAVDAEIIVVYGLSVRRYISIIRKCQETKGAIVFTDPDKNGEKIRKYIDMHVPGVKHAYLSRQDAKGYKGRIGVEYADKSAIVLALKKCNATFFDYNSDFETPQNEAIINL